MTTVYFIQAGKAGPVKIGQTNGAPEKRLANLQSAHHEPLRIRGTIDGAKEWWFHFRFKKLHLRGEWYRYDGELRKFLENFESAKIEFTAAVQELAARKLYLEMQRRGRIGGKVTAARSVRNRLTDAHKAVWTDPKIRTNAAAAARISEMLDGERVSKKTLERTFGPSGRPRGFERQVKAKKPAKRKR